jgi:hypothetical protein
MTVIDRRAFLRSLGVAAAGTAAGRSMLSGRTGSPVLDVQQPPAGSELPARGSQIQPAANRPRSSAPKSHEFVFARLRYDSGDWDYNPKVCANVLDSVMQYTNIPVHEQEIVITADSRELPSFPFLFMTGHKLVRFSESERKGIARYVESGGLLFSDDCNHDVDGLYAKSFEAEMVKTFPGVGAMAKIPNNHRLYSAFFKFPEGPPQTSHELNGWGDDLVHDYMRGVEHKGRLGVIYSNKDYGCEWDYDWRNKRFQRDDNTRFAVNIVVYAMTS